MKPFIPASLDDLPLTPNQFRIVCHIARRGDCYESVPNMAKHCGISPNTIWSILKHLEACKIIVRARRPGQTSLFAITDEAEWMPPTPIQTVPTKTVHHPPPELVCHPPQSSGHKGNPIKAIPLRGDPAPQINGERVDWKAYCEELKRNL